MKETYGPIGLSILSEGESILAETAVNILGILSGIIKDEDHLIRVGADDSKGTVEIALLQDNKIVHPRDIGLDEFSYLYTVKYARVAEYVDAETVDRIRARLKELYP